MKRELVCLLLFLITVAVDCCDENGVLECIQSHALKLVSHEEKDAESVDYAKTCKLMNMMLDCIGAKADGCSYGIKHELDKMRTKFNGDPFKCNVSVAVDCCDENGVLECLQSHSPKITSQAAKDAESGDYTNTCNLMNTMLDCIGTKADCCSGSIKNELEKIRSKFSEDPFKCKVSVAVDCCDENSVSECLQSHSPKIASEAAKDVEIGDYTKTCNLINTMLDCIGTKADCCSGHIKNILEEIRSKFREDPFKCNISVDCCDENGVPGCIQSHAPKLASQAAKDTENGDYAKTCKLMNTMLGCIGADGDVCSGRFKNELEKIRSKFVAVDCCDENGVFECIQYHAPKLANQAANDAESGDYIKTCKLMNTMLDCIGANADGCSGNIKNELGTIESRFSENPFKYKATVAGDCCDDNFVSECIKSYATKLTSQASNDKESGDYSKTCNLMNTMFGCIGAKADCCSGSLKNSLEEIRSKFSEDPFKCKVSADCCDVNVVSECIRSHAPKQARQASKDWESGDYSKTCKLTRAMFDCIGLKGDCCSVSIKSELENLRSKFSEDPFKCKISADCCNDNVVSECIQSHALKQASQTSKDKEIGDYSKTCKLMHTTFDCIGEEGDCCSGSVKNKLEEIKSKFSEFNCNVSGSSQPVSIVDWNAGGAELRVFTWLLLLVPAMLTCFLL